jgi:hypothetical protein
MSLQFKSLINAEEFTAHELLTKNHSESRIDVDYDRRVSAWYLQCFESFSEEQTERLQNRNNDHLEINTS